MKSNIIVSIIIKMIYKLSNLTRLYLHININAIASSTCFNHQISMAGRFKGTFDHFNNRNAWKNVDIYLIYVFDENEFILFNVFNGPK